MITFTLPSLASVLGLVISVVLPLLVGILTRRDFQHKALVLLGLAAVNGFLVELANFLTTAAPGDVYDAGQALLNTIVSFGLAVLLHYGFLRPEGISAAAQKLGPQ